MDVSNRHNLNAPLPTPAECRFGIRVSMPPRDPLTSVLGKAWQQEHWFATSGERDTALEEMGRRHAYSRIGDIPSIVLTPVER